MATRHSRCEVVFEVSSVCDARLAVEIDAELQVAELDLHGFDEASEGTQAALGQVATGRHSVELQQCGPQGTCEDRRERTLLGRFDGKRRKSARLGIVPDAIEQDRLSNTTQTNEKQALRGEPGADPVERDWLTWIYIAGPEKRG